MVLKKSLNTKIVYDAIYQMTKSANIFLPEDVYLKLANFNHPNKDLILKNAFIASKNKRPLCQDTGQVIVFLEIGQEISFEGEFINDAINKAVEDSYRDNYFRKSTVADAIYKRCNTQTNCPAIIHIEFTKGDELHIIVGIKGGGAENMTKLFMLNPTVSPQEIKELIVKAINEIGENACPPMSIGIGSGGTSETAAMLAKKALYKGKVYDIEHKNVFEAKILTAPTHIASLPLCINFNCHSARHTSAVIKNGEILYKNNAYNIPDVKINNDTTEVFTNDTVRINNLKEGEEIFLSGTIYTARDAAHKKIADLIKDGKTLPLKIKDSIIFYAGPCPPAPGEIIGPIGPTTSKRMDKFAPTLYKEGMLASIGKGERNMAKINKVYFKATGGVASLLQECIKECKLIAFEELESEAIYKLKVEKMPLKVYRI